MKKKSPQGIAILVVLALAGILVNKFVFNSSEKINIGGILNIKAYDLNKKLPLDVDENTRLVKAQYLSPRTLRLDYVLHGISWEEFDLKYFQDSTGHELRKTITNDPKLKVLRDSLVNFEFQYNDTAGRLVHLFHFGSQEYH